MTGLGKLMGAFKVSNNIKIRPTSLIATVARLPAAGGRLDRGCLRDLVPRRWDRSEQGVHGRGAALCYPYSALARERGHGGDHKSVLSMMTQ